MTTTPTDPLLAYASVSLRKSHRKAVTTVRSTIEDRQKHVDQGRYLRERARLAHSEYLRTDARLRPHVRRPRWLTPRINFWGKVLLIASDIGAGTTSLIVAGDPPWLAALTFTGVAVATVLAGTHVGIHLRRREEGDVSGFLHWAAGTAVALGAAMFGVYRFLTVGAVFAVLAFIPVMVAFGSAFLGYLWQDRNSDEIEGARDTYRSLEKDSEEQFTMKVVKRFEEAEAELRPGAWEAVNDAYRQSKIGPTIWQEEQGVANTPSQPPNAAMVEELLVILAGPEILNLIPKVDTESYSEALVDAQILDIADSTEVDPSHDDDEAA